MNHIRLRLLLFVLLTAVAVVLAGCKSESSPTAPPTTTTPGTTTNPTTPPSGATVNLSLSNQNPIAPASVTVTATVSLNGQPVPNGTAVQFTTNIGSFAEAATATPTTVIRTTTNGIATATLTVPSAGSGTVEATVNNVTKSANITVGSAPVIPPPASTSPTITGVSPNTGLPAGGTIITITGTNFRSPVRVIVDPGAASGQAPKDAFVNTVTSTQIVAVTPSFNVSNGATLPVSITVIDEAGTANQQSVTSANAFTYAAAVLSPTIRTLDPTSGPIDGGTRVAILGDAFQAPVQVFFGSAEAQVISINFHEIDVVSPTASQTAAGGSGVVTGPVDVKVTNVASGKSATSPQQFRYVAKMQVTTAGPTIGPFTGGTRVTIDGSGFNAPVAVVMAGVAAQVISVSPTQVVAISSPVIVSGCANVTGPIVVTNTDNGDTANGPQYIYQVLKPSILSVAPAQAGGTTTIVVANAVGFPQFTIAGIPAAVTGSTQNPDGTTTFTVVVPPASVLKLTTNACTSVTGTSAPQPTLFDVGFSTPTTGCTTTLANGILISPPAGPVLTVSGTFTPFTGTITPGSAGPPPTPTTVAVSPASESVSIVNTGNTTPLTINSISTASVGGASGCSAFSISATPPAPTSLNQCDAFTISASYNGQLTPTASPDQCQINVSTSVGTKSFVVSGSTH